MGTRRRTADKRHKFREMQYWQRTWDGKQERFTPRSCTYSCTVAQITHAVRWAVSTSDDVRTVADKRAFLLHAVATVRSRQRRLTQSLMPAAWARGRLVERPECQMTFKAGGRLTHPREVEDLIESGARRLPEA